MDIVYVRYNIITFYMLLYIVPLDYEQYPSWPHFFVTHYFYFSFSSHHCGMCLSFEKRASSGGSRKIIFLSLGLVRQKRRVLCVPSKIFCTLRIRRRIGSSSIKICGGYGYVRRISTPLRSFFHDAYYLFHNNLPNIIKEELLKIPPLQVLSPKAHNPSLVLELFTMRNHLPTTKQFSEQVVFYFDT